MSEEQLKNVFESFASVGAGQKVATVIDSSKYAKLLRDTKVIGKTFTSVDADLIFTRFKTKGATRMTFPEFLASLADVAAKKGVSLEDLKALLCEGQVQFNGATIPAAVKYHDDKSLYTGVYANGGPTNVDKQKEGGLAGLLDRSGADVRGVKHGTYQ